MMKKYVHTLVDEEKKVTVRTNSNREWKESEEESMYRLLRRWGESIENRFWKSIPNYISYIFLKSRDYHKYGFS